ncbi:hypothetical protein V3C10_18265 [[Clostridium] symbiosum]|uniref:hypothetical protein n=1 Tax=Clostridium symbiosum TaxID=1512 RepID=UPI001D081FF5|nr:hypothetical protein [[Clostridium] symbiosum]MCB6611377.1 hypothetical protein [[Clostridium] symbiosum]MCB6931202.1 hypothetical protein [[Clostridium] symbiosum]
MNTEKKSISSMAACSVVYVEKYEDGILSGRIVNYCLKEPVLFHGMGDFAIKMDRIYDFLGLERPDSLPVSFFGQKESGKNGFVLRDKPDDDGRDTWMGRESYIALFVVHTRYRYHSSWQGSIAWPEKSIEKPYNSTLDCIRLMTEAVEYETEQKRKDRETV